MTDQSTEHRPKHCHYDRTLGERVIRGEHRDDCLRGDECPAAGNGCAPCTAPHCVVCGREHATNANPMTCPECLGKVRDDLAGILAADRLLAVEARDGGGDGRLVAAAPIPGGTAQVLIGPTVRLDLLRVGREMSKYNRPSDPIPPLAVLAQWEDIYRTWLDHRSTAAAPATARWGQRITVPGRATLAGAIRYLTTQLPYVAQAGMGDGGPDWLAFTRQVRSIRSQLEHALHDEREPELGVECFECGDRLVRRFRDRRLCTHPTEARAVLAAWMERREVAQGWLRLLATYPELGSPRTDELVAAAAPPAAVIRAARRPCSECAPHQGGIDDPSAGMSWECPGCRKEYDPGEYANAVRRSLIDDTDGTGWCTLQVAAEAAKDISGRPITATTIRTWIARGDDIAVCCEWMRGRLLGAQLVYWPDVLERATAPRRSTGPRRSA